MVWKAVVPGEITQRFYDQQSAIRYATIRVAWMRMEHREFWKRFAFVDWSKCLLPAKYKLSFDLRNKDG